MDTSRSIRTIRIDLPLKSTYAYFFVDPADRNSDPWWGTLWEYLLTFATAGLIWQYEPVQDKFWSRPALTDDQRRDIWFFLRTAPSEQVAEHRTLRRAVELDPDRVTQLEVMYFSDKAKDDAV